MKPRLSQMAIQTLVVVYTFAGIYIGCSQAPRSKSGPVIPSASSLRPKKTENTRLKDQENTEDESEDFKQKDHIKSPAHKDRGNESEDESDGSDQDQSNNGKSSQSESDRENHLNQKPSFCDQNFVDLSSKDQAMVKSFVSKRIDEDDLNKIKITNCQRDRNGDIIFDIDFGKNRNSRGFFGFRRRDRDNDASDQ